MTKTDTTPTRTSANQHVGLATFIRDNVEEIAREWTQFAGTRTSKTSPIGKRALKDHIEDILAFILEELGSSQSRSEQSGKSRGDGPATDGVPGSAAEVHAAQRLHDGFNLDQMVSEYRALRATVLKLWTEKNDAPTSSDFFDMIRFNEAIDQAATESINHFTISLDHSRNLLLGIIGHDLRGPIGAASLSAELMLRQGTLDASQTALAVQINDCSLRAAHILDNLLDLTRVQFGSELPVSRRKTDIAPLTRQLVAEMRASYPSRVIHLQTVGDTWGNFDKIRMGQVLSNLIGNAVEHGFADTAVGVTLEGGEEIVLSVQNEGVPIPSGKVDTLFRAFVRGDEKSAHENARSGHVGLGLYITKKIVDAHGGTIGVTSSDQGGTKFIVRLPRGSDIPRPGPDLDDRVHRLRSS